MVQRATAPASAAVSGRSGAPPPMPRGLELTAKLDEVLDSTGAFKPTAPSRGLPQTSRVSRRTGAIGNLNAARCRWEAALRPAAPLNGRLGAVHARPGRPAPMTCCAASCGPARPGRRSARDTPLIQETYRPCAACVTAARSDAALAVAGARDRAGGRAYGYQEIRLPLLEATELFKRRSRGDGHRREGDVQLRDRNGDSLTLRPEGTAGCVRAAASSTACSTTRSSALVPGPMFPARTAQKGRTGSSTRSRRGLRPAGPTSTSS